MIQPYSTDLCRFCYFSIFNDFPSIVVTCVLGNPSKYIRVKLDYWIIGAEMITANNFILQLKLHLGWKGMKSSSNPCTVLQLEEISLARLQRVGVMKFSNTSFCGWTQLCLSQLLWNYWKKEQDLLLCIEVKQYKYDRIVRGKKSLLARK